MQLRRTRCLSECRILLLPPEFQRSSRDRWLVVSWLSDMAALAMFPASLPPKTGHSGKGMFKKTDFEKEHKVSFISAYL